MIIELEHEGKLFRSDLSDPIDISIPIKEGKNNPNCYYAKDVEFKTIRSGDFVGSVKEGGTVNYKEVLITPHGNGTHTETYGHLSTDHNAVISELVTSIHSVAELITIEPRKLENGDTILSFEDYIAAKKYDTNALVIRSTPNIESKRIKKYSGTNPTYLDHRIATHLNQCGVKHLLVDLPSVDKEVDGGELLAHRAFWGLPQPIRKESTITELIFVGNKVPDGIYLLNIQILNIELDASPSRPVLFKLTES